MATQGICQTLNTLATTRLASTPHTQHSTPPPSNSPQALELPHPAEPIRGLIKALFDQCEKDKPRVQPNEAADREYCRNFALTVFSRADKLDRAKRADINTAKCFYAAAIFLQVGGCGAPMAVSIWVWRRACV